MLLGSMTGCLISSENHAAFTGNYVPSDTLSRIRVGESTPAYTEALMGTPTNKTDLEDGSSIWRWDYTIHKSGEGTLFLIFDGEHSTTKQHATYVEFRDGLVSRKWSS